MQLIIARYSATPSYCHDRAFHTRYSLLCSHDVRILVAEALRCPQAYCSASHRKSPRLGQGAQQGKSRIVRSYRAEPREENCCLQPRLSGYHQYRFGSHQYWRLAVALPYACRTMPMENCCCMLWFVAIFVLRWTMSSKNALG